MREPLFEHESELSSSESHLGFSLSILREKSPKTEKNF